MRKPRQGSRVIGMTTTKAPVWLTRDEAATRLRVSKHTVDRWVRERRLTKYKVGDLQSVRFSAAEVDNLVQPVAPDDQD